MQNNSKFSYSSNDFDSMNHYLLISILAELKAQKEVLFNIIEDKGLDSIKYLGLFNSSFDKAKLEIIADITSKFSSEP